ncbi:hypothetical protein D0463_18385 [Bacillus sp. V59.32b]|nr:hypothetical protein D0463_18385 [Bacillus sp. V59.32b]
MIVYLDTPIWKRNYWILKRFIIQKVGLEKGNYKQTFLMLKNMYRWNYLFEKESRPEVLKILAQYEEKLLILQDNTDIKTNLII